MPATASGSSLVTRNRADHASTRAAPGRPFRVGSDGLPLLPCHDAPVSGMPASSPPPTAVALFGHVDTKQNVRAQLISRYSHSKQLDQISEMTLRIDTELELLRRSCFAQRNEQWGYSTPDQFEYQPTPTDAWTPQPANEKMLLRKMKMDGTLDGSGREFFPPGKTHDKEMMEFVRDRPWPPQEFALKPVAKPSRGRGGKRKAAPMAAVLDPVPLLAKTCRECKTQSTPLWRTQTRTVKVKKVVLKNTAGNDVATNLANAFVAQSMAKMEPQKTEVKMVDEKIEVNLCLQCYLKLERADLFDKKRVEKKKQERRKKDQAASAALQEKKRLKHQIHLLKKHKKQEMLAAEQAAGEQVTEQVQDEAAAPAAVILKFTREEIEAATASSKERKRDRKHSRKDKKKKKKKHRRQREYHEGSESDCPTPIPSPAQMNGYVYADRALDSFTTSQRSAFDIEQAPVEATAVNTEPEALDSGYHEDENEVATPARSSSRKRKSVQYTEPAVVVESPASASKKRKTSSSRSSRSKRAATSVAPAAAVVAAPPTPSVKKRSRTKKELARERELRAQGQYCPVCNEVYEDDDQNTFVCCDSCELWVHGACDPSLTPAIIAAMANTEDKYICPLCAGR
ncbi:Pleckstrin homology domain-containing proteinD [Phytophthora infestans]|uniref:PHD finger domain-containing protein n=1 Tax=Phytophthora infestans TaxID=4787 RepID=A0A833SBX3_PHYIN|nr:Pleckstrin homology domain-containing proteinD [Phytophthora infestans]KAF4131803.1 PHD finger domain-containing protein [Phytophthora infestans]KAF4131820.1 PHD finger domain-containing protein [Phytophthora infestans]